MRYAHPGQAGSIVTVYDRYENFIGGKWLAPVDGRYRVNLSPATPPTPPRTRGGRPLPPSGPRR
jgi:aldehyde dehydrogenase